MDINTLLQNTLSIDENIRRQSEKQLEEFSKQPRYAVNMLQIVSRKEPTSLSAAINFKNFIKKKWKIDEDGVLNISEDDRNTVKSHVVNLMLEAPENIQKQLSEAISIIGKEDFPENWTNLLQDMVNHFASGDFNRINGVLRTAHSLFKKYRYEFRSDNLYREINHVIANFANQLTQLFLQFVQILPQHVNNKAQVKVFYSSLVLIAKIFYSLNYQDLPEFFEDNMKVWMENFERLLETNIPVLATDDDDEPGLVEHLRSQICMNISMFAQKYGEEFKPHVEGFVGKTWNMLVGTGREMKYDLLVSHGINFLKSVCDRPQYKQMFESEQIMLEICQKVICPNIMLRESDVEQFEDNPEEYIRRDMEGSDVDTRRRAACDLVKSFTNQFEERTTKLFTQYVQEMLNEYAADNTRWAQKDAAIYLVTSLANQGATKEHGATKRNQFVDVEQFFHQQIVPELQNADPSHLPVLKADALRYVVTFRSMLGRNNLIQSLPLIVGHLDNPCRVVHTYACHVIERLLVVKNPGENTPLITAADIEPHLNNILTKCFAAMEMEGSQENEYCMKSLMRVVSLAQASLLPCMELLVQKLLQKLSDAARNPTNPLFNHYLFETFCLSIRITLNERPDAAKMFEDHIYPIFIRILENGIDEFTPYVFQIMSLVLELRPQPIPQIYMNIFPGLLKPVLWENKGNIAPLSRLLQAIVDKNARGTLEKLIDMKGVSQRLMGTKTNFEHGLGIITSLFKSISEQELGGYRDLFSMLFVRLQRNKTNSLVRGLLVVFANFINFKSPNYFKQQVDTIQTGMFEMVVEKVIIPDLQKVLGRHNRKMCFVAYTNLLTKCASMTNHQNNHLWCGLLESLVALMELPEDQSKDEHFADIDQNSGYQNQYSQLNFAKKHFVDETGVTNPKQYLAQQISELSKTVSVRVKLQNLNGKVQKHIQNYMSQARMNIHS